MFSETFDQMNNQRRLKCSLQLAGVKSEKSNAVVIDSILPTRERRRRRADLWLAPSGSHGYEVLATSISIFLSLGTSQRVTSPVHWGIIFLWTVYSRCTHSTSCREINEYKKTQVDVFGKIRLLPE